LEQTLDQIATIAKNSTDDALRAADLVKQASQVLEAFRNKAAERAYQESVQNYGQASRRHGFRELLWGIGFAIASLLFAASVMATVFWGQELFPVSGDPLFKPSGFDRFAATAKQMLFVGVFVFFVKITLTKYNAERHLRILYDHRLAALEHLKAFEVAIDGPDRSSLRLEAAKMLLSDPASSYASKGDATEVNISPRFSGIDRGSGT